MRQLIFLSQYKVNIKEAKKKKKTGYDLCWEIPDPAQLLFYAH